MQFFGFGFVHDCLDDAFDAPDVAADAELCRAIAAGRWGLHPDGWGNHDPLPLRWLLRKRDQPQAEVHAAPVDPEPEAKPVPRKRGRPRKPDPPAWKPPPFAPPFAGEIQLTCDECGRRFNHTLHYGSGQREAMAAGLRAVGKANGWTHIDGRDRCPKCSPVAPKNVGNGAGQGESDKQHADGG